MSRLLSFPAATLFPALASFDDAFDPDVDDDDSPRRTRPSRPARRKTGHQSEQAVFDELRAAAARDRRPPGWVGQQFRAHFGHWPRGLRG